MSRDPFYDDGPPPDYYDGGDIRDQGYRHRDEGSIYDEPGPDDELSNGGLACRVCGCSDEQACEGGCVWAEEDLCSRCARGQGRDA